MRQRATSCKAMAVDQSCQTQNSSYSHAKVNSGILGKVVGLGKNVAIFTSRSTKKLFRVTQLYICIHI